MANTRPKKRSGNDEHPAIWIAYGKLVKLFREQAGLTQQQLADAVGYSYEQTASIEQGRRPAKAAFTQAAERVLDARVALAALQEDVDLAKLPLFFRGFADIEPDAVSFFGYGNHVVPGLLQTEDYARALLQAHCPPLSEATIEHRVEARLARQALLNREPVVECSFVIGESVLGCPVGGCDVMREQLKHLLRQLKLRNVELQVMPTAHGSHARAARPDGLA